MTVIVQVLFPATVIFENDIGSLTVDGEAEPQPLYATFVFDKETLVGRSSVKFTLDIEVVPGLVMEKVSVEVPPGRIVLGENDLVRLALIIFA